MVVGWAKDVAEGKETAMLAWRRANVAALNAGARAAMAEAGRLSGPELRWAATSTGRATGSSCSPPQLKASWSPPNAAGHRRRSRSWELTVTWTTGQPTPRPGRDRPRPARPRLRDDGPPQPRGHFRHRPRVR